MPSHVMYDIGLDDWWLHHESFYAVDTACLSMASASGGHSDGPTSHTSSGTSDWFLPSGPGDLPELQLPEDFSSGTLSADEPSEDFPDGNFQLEEPWLDPLSTYTLSASAGADACFADTTDTGFDALLQASCTTNPADLLLVPPAYNEEAATFQHAELSFEQPPSLFDHIHSGVSGDITQYLPPMPPLPLSWYPTMSAFGDAQAFHSGAGLALVSENPEYRPVNAKLSDHSELIRVNVSATKPIASPSAAANTASRPKKRRRESDATETAQSLQISSSLAFRAVAVPSAQFAILSGAPCIKCWMSRKQCSGGRRCYACVKAKPEIPEHLCIKARLTDLAVFSRFKEPDYRARLLLHVPHRSLTIKKARVQHFRAGPTLDIECCHFKSTSKEQLQVHWKDRNGWRVMETTAYALKDIKAVDVQPYVREHITLFCKTMDDIPSQLHYIFKLAMKYHKNALVDGALRIWSASRLLIQGWEMSGPEMLGMTVMKNPRSPLLGSVTAPRILQNQLDSLLELYITQCERALLEGLEQSMKKRQRSDWIPIFLAITILLHALERDTWRLLYWLKHEPAANKWRHPLAPLLLVERATVFANVLVAHFGIAGQGSLPLQLDWTQPHIIANVGGDPDIVDAMKQLQLCSRSLRKSYTLGRRRCLVLTVFHRCRAHSIRARTRQLRRTESQQHRSVTECQMLGLSRRRDYRAGALRELLEFAR
ncbi:hypothetical protein BAUCODRAFT_426020 [Baudoinia panamericana UAMH 10762]|uniref:Zn(2)-C6 fungal-type domain-containing protein n=1 Tax=Baudoinia panamericana (strain UAMH 10762) TaxID=717646 RepID=M2NGJ8_BAUPA|nr:uncharacterized protein BAUCODRAFT_426020 [Baudoinia panamericana UAMH 10762]EMC98434.1 hypothetical protein BAUCODRAFT_426020 [Baudoinia panamericana UAMH 10762]